MVPLVSIIFFYFIYRLPRDEESPNKSSDEEFTAIVDRFHTLKEVSKEIRKEGIDKCGLIFGKP